jgi:hypothetical protein
MRENLFHASSLASGLLAIFDIPWLVELCLHVHMVFKCICVQISPFDKDTKLLV